MIFDTGLELITAMEAEARKAVDKLPVSFPCEVIEVLGDPKGFVKIQTLLPQTKEDTETPIPILQSPYLTLPINKGDIGLALNCSYIFEKMLLGEKIEDALQTQGANGLFFIPMLKAGDLKNDLKSTTLTNQEKNYSLTLTKDNIALKADQTALTLTKDDASFKTQSGGLTLKQSGVTLESSSTIELKGASATLGEVVGDILTLLLKMNTDPVAGNGAPLASSNLISGIPQIQAKLKGNFK